MNRSSALINQVPDDISISELKNYTEYLDDLAEIVNKYASSDRSVIEKRHGQVWDDDELAVDFEITGTFRPFVAVSSRLPCDNAATGTLVFQDEPRLYFDFLPD